MGLLAIRVGTRASRTEVQTVRRRARRITPEAGRALEILGHAIEYMVDEYVNQAEVLAPTDPHVKAIQLLMSLNRQVYFECPVAKTFGDRVRGWLERGNR